MAVLKLSRARYELLVLVAMAAITTPVFWLTDFDRLAAALFYQPNPENHWPLQRWWLSKYLYEYAPNATMFAASGALLLAILGHLIRSLSAYKRPAIYIFLVIVLGPGLIVNLIFKDHWGRPRPVHINEFGGQHHYIPPLQIGHTREKSFPCGHCSVGYMLFALYFLARKGKAFYFCLAVLAGLVFALVRMSAGGHFVSDVLWSGYLVFFVSWAVYYGWYARQSG